MNTQRFTIKSQELLADMQDLASGYGHREIKDLHLLQAMLSRRKVTIQPALEKLEVSIPKVKSDVENALNKLPKIRVEVHSSIYLREFWTYCIRRRRQTSFRMIIFL